MATAGNPIERAAAQLGAGRIGEAKTILEAALRAAPRDVTALMMAGVVAAKLGDGAAALAFMERAVKAAPRNPQTYANYGAALNKAGRANDAIKAYRAAIACDPNYHPAHVNLGIILNDEERCAEAVTVLRRAVALAPQSAEAHHSLGNALTALDELDEAIAHYEKALELKPGFLNAMNNIGIALGHARRHGEAVRHLQALYQHAPGFKNTLGLLVHAKHQICDWSNDDAMVAELRRTIAEGRPALPAFLLHLPIPPDEIMRASRTYALNELAPDHPIPPRAIVPQMHQPRLRIGYLSEDLREHAVARLAVETFELHDKLRFEIFAYSTGRNDGSEFRRRIEGAVDHFIDARLMGREALAARIVADQIGILVDLQGYTGRSRSTALGLRPAPVQVNWLGYPGTMGAPWIDYIIADRNLIPEGMEYHYAEKILRLPGTYQPNDRQRTTAIPKTRKEYGLPEDGFVFCSFNQPVKITPQVFASWMRILASVRGAVLWLLDSAAEAETHLRREAMTAGIDPARIVFAHRLPQADHLARYRVADLALDTMPYGSHTTGSDALRQGCPLVTCTQTNTFAARVAASLLHAAELPDLITDNLADYEALAIALATDPSRLAAIRVRLDEALPRCALFDSPRFVRDLERAYETIWHRALSGLPPDHVTL